MPTINGFSSQIGSLSLNFESINNSQVKGSEPISIVIDPKDLNISLNQNSPKTIRVSSKDVEIQLFKKFGFDVKNGDELAALKQRLGGKDPFAHVESDPNGYTAKLENGKYVIKTSIETKLLKELKGVAAQAKSESPTVSTANGENPNNVEAAKSGGDLARQRAEFEKKLPPRIPGHVPGLPPGDLKNAVEKFQKVEKMAEELGHVAREALAQPGAMDALLDEAQGALDLIGIVDPTPIADGASAIISFAREQYGYAALSIVAAVLPYGGDLLKLAKLPKLVKSAEHAVEFAAAAPKMTEKTLEKLQALKKVLDEVPLEGVPKATREAIEGLTKKVDDAVEIATTAKGMDVLPDLMAKANNGKRVLIGRRATSAEISAVEAELSAGGVKVVRNADSRLDKLKTNGAAAFNFETGELLIRKDVTALELFHETTHAKQWAELGKDGYKKVDWIDREEHVYKTIMENKGKFSQREIDEAARVINNYRIDKSRELRNTNNLK